MKITSSQNEKIKRLRELLKSNEYFVLDSKKVVEEAISANTEIVNIILLDENNKNYPEDKCLYVSQNVFDLFSNTKTSQGVIGIFKYKKKQLKPPGGNFLILDNLQDPGNVGTLIRSALGANFFDIYLVDCASITNPKTIRSTMGAGFKTNIYEVSKSEFIGDFKTDKTIYVCDMNGEDIFNTQTDKSCGIIIGNEGNGVSKEMKSLAKKTIKIPMQNGLESLNAGVSGSIIMYQIYNQNK